MISVLVVDDQELMRESLRILIDSNHEFKVIALAADSKEALNKISLSRPDVVLMDIRMPDLNGIECARLVKEIDQSIKIIILTTFNDDEYILQAIKYGVDGFLLKGVSKEELFNSISAVHNGCSAIDPQTAKKAFSIFNRLANSPLSTTYSDKDHISGDLSPLELKIVQLIGKGCSNKEIVSICNLAEGTTRNYISTILKKLGLKSRTQLAILAIQSGIMLHDY